MIYLNYVIPKSRFSKFIASSHEKHAEIYDDYNYLTFFYALEMVVKLELIHIRTTPVSPIKSSFEFAVLFSSPS